MLRIKIEIDEEKPLVGKRFRAPMSGSSVYEVWGQTSKHIHYRIVGGKINNNWYVSPEKWKALLEEGHFVLLE